MRVQGSGQYRLMQPEIAALDGLDHRLSVAVHAHDEQQVHAVLGQMITLVQRRGTSVGPDELVTSTTILPPDTIDIEDVQALLHGDSTIWTGEPTPVPVDAR